MKLHFEPNLDYQLQAIKEGVYKSLQITEEHFKAIEVRESPAAYVVATSVNDVLGLEGG